MFDKNYLLPVDALQLLIDALKMESLPVERLKIEECYGRILASDIISPEDLPAFSRSTVDGYAVNSSDTFGASESSPAYITVKYEVRMGVVPDFTVKSMESSAIPTGGMMPAGSDAVVMLEHAQIVSTDMIEVTRAAAPGENVIQKGEDIKRNEIIFHKGEKLRAQDIGALAGVGLKEVVVYKKPLVSVISTGDEIVPHDMTVSFGQIRDINTFTLTGLINDSGGIALRKGIFKDDYEAIKNVMLQSLSDSDMVLISGGTSAGTKDMVAMIINDIGRPGVLFHGLSLKPGKPMIGGVINNKPVLGLPGHPVAVAVCFDLFIRQLLETLAGLSKNKYPYKTMKAKITKNIASAAGREDHIRVVIEEKDGAIVAHPVLGKSGLISVLAKADGSVVIPHNKMGLDAGDEVTVRLF
jgi:molybdopterin molybdotransferase